MTRFPDRSETAFSPKISALFHLNDNFSLDYNPANPAPNGYAVFGQVISGTETIGAIGRVATGPRAGLSNVPTQDVVVQGMLRLP